MNKILLHGTGAQAEEYLKVLGAQGLLSETLVLGRNASRLTELQNKFQVSTGLFSELEQFSFQPGWRAISAVAPEALPSSVRSLIGKGCKKILVEKPVSVDSNDIESLAKEKTVDIGVAFNRRYYSSILEAKKRITQEAPSSCVFEFTELSHLVEKMPYSEKVLNRWALVNSIHVLDTVEFLLGPIQMNSHKTSGANELNWHKQYSKISILGQCQNVPIVGFADWSGPGRWNIEVICQKTRLKLCPLEKLQIQKKGSFDWHFESLNDELDKLYKPGLFNLVVDFLIDNPQERSSSWVSMESYRNSFLRIEKIFGYAT